MRIRDELDESYEQVISKWYYELSVEETTKVFVGLHQEDERISGVLLRRPFIDVAVAILKVQDDGSLTLLDHKNFSRDRQVELEVELAPGRYLVVPRTTGGLMTKPSSWEEKPKTALVDRDGNLTKVFESVIEDIFRKFDLFSGRELSFDEFKPLYRCTGMGELTESDYKRNILDKHCSTSEGLTLRGLKHWFSDSIQSRGEDEIRAWLNNLGYDQHLFNVDSRSFTLTFHCINKFSVVAKDASRTSLDSLATCLVTQREIDVNGPMKDFVTRRGIYQLVYSFSEYFITIILIIIIGTLMDTPSLASTSQTTPSRSLLTL